MNTPVIVTGTLSVLVLLCILSCGCTTTSLPAEEEQPSPANTGAVVEANNRFAWDLYHALETDEGNAGKNIFFSPHSISTALALTYEGAEGETADEIRSVLYFPENKSALREGYKALIAEVNRGDSAYTLRTANAIWAEKTHPFLPGYLSVAEDYYGAEVENLNFISAPEESRLTINGWVEDRTEEKIKNLIPAGAITSLTRLVITNAVYFKGTWVLQFDESLTTESAFTTAGGETVTVEMMQRTGEDARYNYTETETLQILKMPYEHDGTGSLSMLVLLPKENDIGVAEKALGAQELAEAIAEMEETRVDVYFPKFSLECDYMLTDTLPAMGMPTAFGPGADFSGLDGTRELFISDVIHKAFVEVNEEGTEAAAATAVVFGKGAAIEEDPVPVFRADHPFVFMIVDDEHDTVLFMGRVADPDAA
ncbi:MAG TPA: serpin family protein [Methanoculleus sp.]|nr:serpin family protein [Methanoculleus sp.]